MELYPEERQIHSCDCSFHPDCHWLFLAPKILRCEISESCYEVLLDFRYCDYRDREVDVDCCISSISNLVQELEVSGDVAARELCNNYNYPTERVSGLIDGWLEALRYLEMIGRKRKVGSHSGVITIRKDMPNEISDAQLKKLRVAKEILSSENEITIVE